MILSPSFLNFQYAPEVLLLIFGGLITQFFTRFFERKPKIIAYIGQAGIFKLKKRETFPEAEISTHQLVIKNNGKKSAKNLNVVHVNLPEDFTVFPVIDWNIKELDYGAKAFIFPSLAPSQQITIAYLYPPNFPLIHGEISHDEGMAKIIKVLPMRQYHPLINFLCLTLMLTGLFFLIYVLFFLLTHFHIL